jgi:rubrerythrin
MEVLMSDRVKRGISMLEAALKLEEKGRAYYKKAINEVRNKLGKEMLRTLLCEERVHMDRIRKISSSLISTNAWSDEWRSIEGEKNAINAVFKKMVKEHRQSIKAKTSDIDALELGIDLELESIRFYEEHLQQATDKLEKAFLSQIIDEEKLHHSSLEDMKLYLKDPQTWFTEHEHHTLDGA